MTPSELSAPPRLLPRGRAAAILLAGATAMALLSFWYRYLDRLARGRSETFLILFIEEFTGVFIAVALLLPVVWLTQGHYRRRVAWQRALLLHVPALAAFAALHTALLWGSRSLLFPLAGLGAYSYGVMPVRFLMELGIQIPIYVIAVGATIAWEHRRAGRAKDLRLARLEAELATARLANLEHQLRPHFLFNALNTVSSVMYDDLGRADHILNDLGRLLRRSLRKPEAALVPLGEELENAELYLGIARARFEERLDARIEADDDALGVPVPPLLLQPLIENALNYGGDWVWLRVGVVLREGRVEISVVNGAPPSSGAGGGAGAGVGGPG
jgi:two-component system, LytTR family, sensor kinase